MGIKPILKRQPNFPREYLGYAKLCVTKLLGLAQLWGRILTVRTIKRIISPYFVGMFRGAVIMTSSPIIRVEIDKPKPPHQSTLDNVLDKLKDLGPVLTGVAGFLLSVVSFYYVHTLDTQKQALAAEKAGQSAIALREKAITAFNKDAPTREIAAISLAAYGKSSLPVLRILLSGSDDITISDQMRAFGGLTAARWMDAGDPDARMLLLYGLRNFARSDSVRLRRGTFETLQQISPGLSSSEMDLEDGLLVERFGTGNQPVESSPDVANAACPLINKCEYGRCRIALRNIAVKFASKQALDSYGTLLISSPQSCSAILADLDYVRKQSTSVVYREDVDKLTNIVKGRCKQQ